MRVTLRGFHTAALVLVLAVGALAPAVLADHAYSHRYLVHGRVTGADGGPVENATVFLQVDFQHGGICADQPGAGTEAWGETTTRPRTNGFGEWFYCIHAHGMARDAQDGIRAHLGNDASTVNATVDAAFRKTTLNLTMPDASANGTDAWDASYTVSGRLWQASPNTNLEGVNVHGVTLNDEPVVITYWRGSLALARAESTTDGYGDFAVRLDVGDVRATDEVMVEGAGAARAVPAEPAHRWTDLKIDVDRWSVADDEPSQTEGEAGGEPAPVSGGASTPTPAPALVALAACAAAALTARRR